jgi:hypothetical protein
MFPFVTVLLITLSTVFAIDCDLSGKEPHECDDDLSVVYEYPNS